MNRFRILIADDNDLVRTCMVRLMEDSGEMEVVGQADNGCSTVEMTKRLLPDAVILDIHMPRMDGIEASRAIHSEFPEIQVIGYSILDKLEAGEKMIKAGAAAYFSKADPWDEVLFGIHRLLIAKHSSASSYTSAVMSGSSRPPVGL
jgi:two-component system invasion response regulator UvrY